MAATNRRHFPRKKEAGLIQVFVAQKRDQHAIGQSDAIPVKMVNQSDDGFYIETDRDIAPGLRISLKMVAPGKERSEAAYHMRHGRVVWCKKVRNGRSPRFAIGVKVFEKVVQAEVSGSRF